MANKIGDKKNNRLAENLYIGTLQSITPEPKEEPKKYSVGFKLDSGDEVVKEYPAAFDPESTLRMDTERILGRDLTRPQAEDFDLDQLIGMKAKLGVFYKAGAGGKPNLAVALVLPIDQTA